ncbi:MAG: class I SAM-dependent methyltransferase [Phycisphaerales bacterium]
MNRPSSTKLHLGCGLVTPDGWINVDGSWNARLAKWPFVRKALAGVGIISKDHAERQWSQTIVYHDVRKRLPWGSGSMDAVYQSHLLEHLYRKEAQFLLEECFRVLSAGGVLRVVVPDLETIVREYVASEGAEDAADVMNKKLLFRELSAGRRSLLGLVTSFTEFHSHKFMYDGPCLSKYMRQAGFGDVSVRECFDSRIDGIRDIERENRAGAGGLCVEGVKPH